MPINRNITRYQNGVTNHSEDGVFGSLPVPDQARMHGFVDDFDKYTAAQWVVGGVGTPVAPLLVAGDGGILSLTNTAASGDNNWIQQLVTSWTFVAGKRVFFKALAQVDDATLAVFSFGLQIAVAGNNFLTPADGVFIRKPAADTNVYLVSRVGGVETLSAALGVVAAGTQFNLEFAYDGAGNIVAGLNGVAKASITPAAITAVPLKITAGIQNGSAVVRVGLVDQLACYKER